MPLVNVVFDLDGTLLDSAPDLHAAANRMLAREQLAPLSLPTVKSFIGNGVPKLVERIMAARGLAPLDHSRLVDAFMAEYEAEPATLTVFYPNVLETLTELKRVGHRLGLCTNKPEHPARKLLREFEMSSLFDVVVGGDTFSSRKPEPDGLIHCFRTLGAGPMLFVGDSEVDSDTAAAANCPFALFTEGYRKASVSQIAHDFEFEDFAQLPRIVAEVAQASITMDSTTPVGD